MMKVLRRYLMIGLLALLAVSPAVQAADNYLVIQRGTISLSDGAASRRVLTFTLPSNTSTSASTTNSAVLQLMATDVNFTHNEIYLNPPTTVCTDDGAEDANQPASVHLLTAHPTVRETFTDHRAFSSALLQPGIACTANNDCAVSNVCQAGLCRNRLMICSRTEGGFGDTSTNNVDNFSIHSIVLHYKTN